jgi:hypothetical protein
MFSSFAELSSKLTEKDNSQSTYRLFAQSAGGTDVDTTVGNAKITVSQCSNRTDLRQEISSEIKGYPFIPHLLTPIERVLTAPERRYEHEVSNKKNNHLRINSDITHDVAQARTRNPIEQAFGVVKCRFACLQR